MSKIKVNVDIEVEYEGDEQVALADLYDVIEELPADYVPGPLTPITGLTVQGWST